MYYRPLPKNVTIKNSSIHGLGLFAVSFIPAKTRIGLTHIYSESYQDNYIRTPLGGFFNHNSVNPNCIVVKEENLLFLETVCDVNSGDELTAKYTLYNPEQV